MRYVHPLIDQQRDLLENTMTHDAAPRARARAHSLLLSAQGLTIQDITKIYTEQKDQQVEAEQKRREVLLAMPKVVFDWPPFVHSLIWHAHLAA